jgi:hypothetical protein
MIVVLLSCGAPPAVTPASSPGVAASTPVITPTARVIRGGSIDVTLPPDIEEPLRTQVLDWIFASADTVGAWYGTFPVPNLHVEITLVDGDEVAYATTYPGRPPYIVAPVGRQVQPVAFGHDWMMVHEMTHTAFPPVESRHHWIEEGLSTYLEPWERVAAGRLSPEEAWHDFARDLPQGITKHGLDRDGDWASTYWGGALYCFLADLAIREKTANRLGLRDAVKAIGKMGGMTGDGSVTDLASILAVGDEAVGTPALTETWVAMRDTPPDVDLPALWKRLGVEMAGDTVRFHDEAPDSAIRRAIAPSP